MSSRRLNGRTPWAPSKYVLRQGRLAASFDATEVGPGSSLIARINADMYEELLPAYATGALLDVACGKAPLFGRYVDLVSYVVRTDWPASLHGSQHVDVFSDVGRGLPFRTDSFQTVLASDVIEHLPDPAAAFREFARVLAPGGRLIANIPFMYWLHELPHDYQRFTEQGLRRLATNAGFRVLRLDALGGAPHVLADVLGKSLCRLPMIGGALARVLQGLILRLADPRTPTRFPLCYFLVAEKGP